MSGIDHDAISKLLKETGNLADFGGDDDLLGMIDNDDGDEQQASGNKNKGYVCLYVCMYACLPICLCM
jgi:hypothetical protein